MATDTVQIRITPEAREALREQKNIKDMSYSESIKQFTQAKTSPPAESPPETQIKIGPLSRNSGKLQGVTFISQAGQVYNSPPITIAKVNELLINPYIASKLEKRASTYFPDRLIVEATDPQQNVNEEVTHILQNMCDMEDVRLNERVLQADVNSYSYGMAMYNPVWVRNGGEIFLQQLRHLPAWSFDTAPYQTGTYENWSPILYGVILNPETGKPEYWQRTDAYTLETEQITNILTVRNPKDEGLAGNSKLIPLIQVIEMIKYVWNTDMQAIHRAGSPIFFLKITNPRSAEDPQCNGVSDVDYGNLVISGWNKDKQYILRENMEIISLPIGTEIDVLKTHDVLKSVIDDYFSISNMISKDGTLIGGSSIPELKLLNQAIRGLHNWLLAPFETLLNQYFKLNGFPVGWTVKIKIPVWEEDKSEQNLKAADMGIKGQCVDLDDLRQLLGLEIADEKKKKSIEEFWTKKAEAMKPDPALLSGTEIDKDGNVKVKEKDVEDAGIEEEEDTEKGKEEKKEEKKESPDKKKKEEKTQKEPHAHEAEGDDYSDPIADSMTEHLNRQLDSLASKILKGL